MRRTTTIRSHFTTCIPSWPAKPVALALSWVFLLILSCKDDASLVGFRKDPRLATRFVEIPLDNSVILREPIITQNISTDDVSRLLVGKATDPDFGSLEAKAFFNFSPPIQQDLPTAAATFVSLTLQLKFDYYVFGATDSSDLQLQVHEILEQMTPDRIYYSGTQVLYDAPAIGDTTFAPGPDAIADAWIKNTDNNATNNVFFSIPIRLSGSIGPNLLDDLINNRNILNDFAEFSAKYPGLAITMPVGNKILGFTPVYSLPTPTTVDSRLILKYVENNTTVQLDLPIYYTSINNIFNPVVSFTNLQPNRSGGPLDGLIPFQDHNPGDGKMYVQSGTGIMSKFNLKKIYDYFDTVNYAVINSAEMILDNTYIGRNPQEFQLLLLDSLNQFRDIYADTLVNGKEVNDPYLVKVKNGVVPLAVGKETRVALFNELTGSTASINQATGKVGLTIMTEFFQQIISHKDEKGRALSFALHPLDNEFNKSVSILKLAPSSAKVRIYYSTPLTSLP